MNDLTKDVRLPLLSICVHCDACILRVSMVDVRIGGAGSRRQQNGR